MKYGVLGGVKESQHRDTSSCPFSFLPRDIQPSLFLYDSIPLKLRVSGYKWDIRCCSLRGQLVFQQPPISPWVE